MNLSPDNIEAIKILALYESQQNLRDTGLISDFIFQAWFRCLTEKQKMIIGMYGVEKERVMKKGTEQMEGFYKEHSG